MVEKGPKSGNKQETDQSAHSGPANPEQDELKAFQLPGKRSQFSIATDPVVNAAPGQQALCELLADPAHRLAAAEEILARQSVTGSDDYQTTNALLGVFLYVPSLSVAAGERLLSLSPDASFLNVIVDAVDSPLAELAWEKLLASKPENSDLLLFSGSRLSNKAEIAARMILDNQPSAWDLEVVASQMAKVNVSYAEEAGRKMLARDEQGCHKFHSLLKIVPSLESEVWPILRNRHPGNEGLVKMLSKHRDMQELVCKPAATELINSNPTKSELLAVARAYQPLKREASERLLEMSPTNNELLELGHLNLYSEESEMRMKCYQLVLGNSPTNEQLSTLMIYNSYGPLAGQAAEILLQRKGVSNSSLAAIMQSNRDPELGRAVATRLYANNPNKFDLEVVKAWAPDLLSTPLTPTPFWATAVQTPKRAYRGDLSESEREQVLNHRRTDEEFGQAFRSLLQIGLPDNQVVEMAAKLLGGLKNDSRIQNPQWLMAEATTLAEGSR